MRAIIYDPNSSAVCWLAFYSHLSALSLGVLIIKKRFENMKLHTVGSVCVWKIFHHFLAGFNILYAVRWYATFNIAL